MDQHGILRIQLAELSLAAGIPQSIDTPQMSPLPEDFNNRVRVRDSDVAAPLSPLGFCLAMCKFTIIVLINRFNGIIHVHTEYAGGNTLPVQNPWVDANARPSPFYSTGVQLCLVLQRLRLKPVVALLNSLITTAT